MAANTPPKSGQVNDARDSKPGADALQLVRRSGAQLRAGVLAISAELIEELNAFFPELGERQLESAHLERSVVDNMNSIFSMFEGGIAADVLSPPPSALYWPRHMAHEGVSADLLTRVYYVGHAIIWQRWMLPELVAQFHRAGVTDPAALTDALRYSHHELFTYLDQAALMVAHEFDGEQSRANRGSAMLRTQVVLDMLADRSPSPAAMQRLSYDVSAHHVGFICWLDPDQAEATETRNLEALAADVAAALGSRHPLILSRDAREVWGWVNVPRGLNDYRSEAICSLAGRYAPALHVALGEAATGLPGFRRTHRDARKVHELITSTHRPAPTATPFPDIALVALLTADRRAARDFATRQLGDLAADDPELRAVRETVATFLETRGSYTRTAQLLTVHRNTVLYRLRKAETLRGAGLDQSSRELQDALLIVQWLDSTEQR